MKEKSSRVAKGKSADAEPGSAVKKKGAAGGAETLKLKWTKEARLQIFPKRGYPYEGYEPPRDPDRLLRLMKKRYSGYQHELRSDLAEGDAKKLMKAVKPFMNNAEDPGEVDSEAAAAVLLGINEVHPYVQEERAPFWIADYWVALKGCAFALQVMVRTFGLGISHNDRYYDSGSEFGEAPPSYSWLSIEQGCSPVFEEGNASLPFTIRFHLAATSDEDYEAARAWAAEIRPSQPLTVRCALACTFPDEEQWGLEAFRDCMEMRKRHNSFPSFGKPLLTVLKDPASALELIRNADLTERELYYGATMLDSMGPAVAFPLLCALLDAVEPSYMDSTKEARRMGASTIASIEGEAVAAYLIRYCNDRDISRIATDYIKKHPRLSISPLLAAKDSKKAHSDYIEVLLASVRKALGAEEAGSVPVEKESPNVAVESDSGALPAPLREDISDLPSSMPSFWEIGALTRPRLSKTGNALPDPAMERLGRLCAAAGAGRKVQLLIEARDSLDRISFDGFLWDLFCSWEMAGAPSKHRWPLDVLAYPGTDDLLYRLAVKAAKWNNEHQAPKASKAYDVFAHNGSDTALAILYAFAQTEGAGHPSGAEELFNEAAERQRLCTEKLALRVLPDTGLDHTGSRTFAFSSGAFRAGFDDSLQPFLTGPDSVSVDDFPQPDGEEDVMLLREARHWWDSARMYVSFYGNLQRQLLIDGSDFDNYPSVDWKAEGFMLFMTGGTYAPHLVRSTVFARFDSNLPYGYVPDRKCTAVFIIADDGTPLDHRERPITFKTNSAVMIPSPYQDYPGNLRAMAKIFKRLNRNLLFGAFKAPD